MKKMRQMFANSLGELQDVRKLSVMAMMLALAVVLGFYATVQVGDFLKIGFAFIPNELTGMLFGPAAGGLLAALADIAKYLVKPVGAFFPGFTVSALLGGVIYGVVLYKRPLSLKRVIVANTLVTVFVNLLLNTYWLTVLYGSAFGALLPARILKEAILLPIDILLYYAIARVLGRARAFHGLQGAAK